MIRPVLKNSALISDINSARRESGSAHLWWLGQSGYLLHWRDHFALLDPYLSDSLTRKYEETDKPHVRMTERVIDPNRLDFIDVITASHHHTDHMDPETLQAVVARNPDVRLVAPRAHRDLAAQRSGLAADRIDVLDADRGPDRLRVGPWEIIAVPAAHEKLSVDSNGDLLHLGFILKFGPYSLYHSGDTVLYPGMAERIDPHGIQVAILPINGRGPERRVSGNLWGHEAVGLARSIHARTAIPCHYDMFTFNTATTEEFESAAKESGQAVRILNAGERFTFGTV